MSFLHFARYSYDINNLSLETGDDIANNVVFVEIRISAPYRMTL